MKCWRTTLAALLISLAAAPSNAPGQFDMPEANPEATRALADLMAAFRASAALEVKSTLVIELRAGEQKASSERKTAEFVYVRGGPGLVRLNEFNCRFAGEEFTAVHDRTAEAYFRETFDGSPYWALLHVFQDIPFPHIALLWGEEEPADVAMQIAPKTPMIVPMEVISRPGPDGSDETVLTLSGPNGSLVLVIDPETKLLSRARHEVTGGMMVEAGTTLVTEYEFEYLVHADVPEGLASIDITDRNKVEFLGELVPAPDEIDAAGGRALVGAPAPGFVLATVDGDAIDLEEFRGKVVVLDFWATWCQPCRRALPILHQVAAWAGREALPVEIITINVWEARDPASNTPDARLESVKAFWAEQGYTLPVAMDYSDETAVAYGVRGIPATFVIRSDGIVHGHVSSDADALKAAIVDAIEALEAPVDEPHEH